MVGAVGFFGRRASSRRYRTYGKRYCSAFAPRPPIRRDEAEATLKLLRRFSRHSTQIPGDYRDEDETHKRVNFWQSLQIGSGRSKEAALVSAAKRGDRKAFDALLHAHERLLRSFLAKRAGPQEADDILQETWMAAWTGLPSFQGRSRFKAWLFKVALYKCADRLRLSSVSRIEPIDDDIEGDRSAGLNPYAAAELKHVVGAALDELPDDSRLLLEMYYFAELTLPEIAIALNRNLNTVKYQFYKAHDRAAAALADFAPEQAPLQKESAKLG